MKSASLAFQSVSASRLSAAWFFALFVTLKTLDLLPATLRSRQCDEHVLNRGALAIEAPDIHGGHDPAEAYDDGYDQDDNRPDTAKRLDQPQPDWESVLRHLTTRFVQGSIRLPAPATLRGKATLLW